MSVLVPQGFLSGLTKHGPKGDVCIHFSFSLSGTLFWQTDVILSEYFLKKFKTS